MCRTTCTLDEDNRRRLELLTAFGIIEGRRPTKDELVNESIRLLFQRALESYRERALPSDVLLQLMEELSP